MDYQNLCEEPIERRGYDGAYWIWEYPNYSKSYAVVADVARGDGADNSAFHVIEIETMTQVAEYRGKIGTTDYGNMLITVATEYNNALLVIENANIGWDVIQSILERDYKNFYYSPKSSEAFTSADAFLNKYENGTGMVPGFTNNQKIRPLAIAKMISYMNDGTCVIKSARLMEELRTFIWMNGKAQAQHNYNDDLVMAWCIGLYLRDTSLTFMQTGIDSARASLSAMGSRSGLPAVPTIGRGDYGQQNPWQMTDSQGNINDISWLI